mgnify:FL=1
MLSGDRGLEGAKFCKWCRVSREVEELLCER